MAAPRAVRITRRSATAAAPPRSGGSALPQFAENRAGLCRARRLFVVYGVALAAILALTLALSFSGPTPAASRTPTEPWGLVGLAAALGAVGGLLTFGRTPTAVAVSGEELWVRERGGRVRRFPAPPSTRLAVEERYPSGWLAPAPTELVRISPPDGRTRRYIVESSLLTGRFTTSPDPAGG